MTSLLSGHVQIRNNDAIYTSLHPVTSIDVESRVKYEIQRT